MKTDKNIKENLTIDDIPVKVNWYSDGKHSYWFDLPVDNKYGLDVSIGYWEYSDIVKKFLHAKKGVKNV